MTSDRTILIVEAPYYQDVTDALRLGIRAALDEAGYDCIFLQVSGAFEIPQVIRAAIRSSVYAYAGYIASGCVIRGETDHYDHICREVSRAVMDIGLEGHAIGFGVLTCATLHQARARADMNGKDKGGETARACIGQITAGRWLAGTPGGPARRGQI